MRSNSGWETARYLGQLPLTTRLLYVHGFAAFFCAALFVTICGILRVQFQMAYSSMLLNLLPGLLLIAGAFIPDNLLSSGMGSSAKLGLASLLGAVLFIQAGDQQGAALSVAAFLGGFGYVALANGVSDAVYRFSSEQSTEQSSYNYRRNLFRCRLASCMLGAGYAAILLLLWDGSASYSVIQAGVASLLILLAAAYLCLYVELSPSRT